MKTEALSVTSRSRTTIVAVLSLLAVSATACASNTDEDIVEGEESALSEETCTARAKQAEQKSIEDCSKDYPKVDPEVCMSSATDEWNTYYQKLKPAISGALSRCSANVSALSDAKIVADAYPDYSDFKRAKIEGDAKTVATLRQQRAAECALAAQEEDKSTLNKMERNFRLEAARCVLVEAVGAIANATMCTGTIAYHKTFASCRRECGDLAKTSCSPKDYGNKEVPCGQYEHDTSFSLRAGNTCEETSTCKRTKICDDYDKAVESIANQGDCEGGSLVPTIKLENGVAQGIKWTCASAAKSTKSP